MDIKKNDIYTMVIGDFGSEGEGIGKVDGFTLFVKDALIGDEIEVKVIKTKKNYIQHQYIWKKKAISQ